MSTSNFGQPRLVRLVTLLGEFKSGAFTVPRFQRSGVWTMEQRLLLLESVYEGYPVGAILMWTTKRKIATWPTVGPLRPSTSNLELPTYTYLLDGHQRISTLFGTLGLGLYKSEKERENAWEDPQDAMKWKVWFDLDAPDEGPHFVTRRRVGVEPKPGWIPTDVLLDPAMLSDEVERLREQGRPRSDIYRLYNVADRFREYTFALTELQTEDMSVVTTSFKRVNTAGTPMSELHMVKALSWSESFDLETRVDELAATVQRPLWQSFAQEWLLDIAKLIAGLPLYYVKPEGVAQRVKEPGLLEAARDLIDRVAMLLSTLGVHGPKVLPFPLQAIILGFAIKDFDSVDSQRLERWFWATTFSESFAGGMGNARISRAIEHLRNLLCGRTDDPVPDEGARMNPEPDFEFRNARSKGQALILGGSGLDGARVGAREALAHDGREAVVRPFVERRNSSPEIRRLGSGFAGCFVVVGEQLPLRRSGSGWIINHPREHWVTAEAVAALQNGDITTFLRVRSATLAKAEREFLENLGLSSILQPDLPILP